MKKPVLRSRLIGFIIFATSLTTHAAWSQDLSVREQKATKSKPLRYLLYVPEHEADQKLPLLFFLHGGGEGGDDIEMVKKHGPPKLIAEGKKFPFIVVAPQNPSKTNF